MEQAICAHAILSDGYFEVNDTLADPRTADNPLVAAADGARFYAGAALVSPEGLPLGTLCVLDHKPRQLTELQRGTLQVLARQVMAQLEMRRALAGAEALRHEVDHRVKNSLQSLSALAGIKARFARSDEARQALGQLQKRIHTVAMLHEQLYKTDAGSMVDLGKYMENIAKYLGAQAPANVALRCQARSISVPSDQAAAVGTLLNEFVANSLKHAFPNGRSGAVTMTLTRASLARELELTSRALRVLERQRKVTQLAGGLVFVGEAGEAFKSTDDPLRTWWKPAMKVSGIRHRDARQTRHTFATVCLMAGIKPAWAARQMGHSVEMFYRVYSRWIDHADKGAERRKLDGYISAEAGDMKTDLG